MKNNSSHSIIADRPMQKQSISGYGALLFASIRRFVSHLSPTGRAAFLLLVILLSAFAALAPIFPRRITPASAPPDVFSAQRALAHLPVIAREEHTDGSPAQMLVRDYLVQQLTDLGLEVQVQQTRRIENVVARLPGTAPSGAVLLQAHYDSYGGPGAADNGAGVAALLEIMRAFAAGTTPRNDIIALFDDGEEIPDAFTGTKAFVHEHPWMADVKVAIGMDTAVRGFVAIDDTGPNNGWLVQVLARAHTGGVWSSLGGGGGYDTLPFRQAGVRVLELEDNYPFHEQHTPADVPEIVNPGSVQQLGEQALSVARELSGLDLSQTSGEQETYLYVPLLGLAHYPQAWALPLAVVAAVLLVIAFGLALWRGFASWRGLGVAVLAALVTAGLSAAGTNALWKAAPGWFDWDIHSWPDWPEVIPPNGWQIFILSNLAVLILSAVVFRLARRWSARANFSLVGLFILLLPAVATGVSAPHFAIIFTWPVLLGALSWIAAAVLSRKSKEFAEDFGVLLAAIPCMLYIFTLLVVVFMSDGTLSVAITAGVWAILLGIFLPVIDGLLLRPAVQPE